MFEYHIVIFTLGVWRIIALPTAVNQIRTVGLLSMKQSTISTVLCFDQCVASSLLDNYVYDDMHVYNSVCLIMCTTLQVNEFFFYAGMTGVVTFIFVLMAIRYKYVEKQDDSAQATSRAERYTLLDDEKSGAESSS